MGNSETSAYLSLASGSVGMGLHVLIVCILGSYPVPSLQHDTCTPCTLYSVLSCFHNGTDWVRASVSPLVNSMQTLTVHQ